MVVGSVVVGLLVAYLIFANVIQHMAKNKETAIVAIDSSEFEAPLPPKIFYGINVDSMTVEEGVIKKTKIFPRSFPSIIFHLKPYMKLVIYQRTHSMCAAYKSDHMDSYSKIKEATIRKVDTIPILEVHSNS